MRPLFSLATLFTTAMAKTGIMLPLYVYPVGDAGLADWNASITAAQQHPTLNFYIIVNDNSGPLYSPNPPSSMKDFAPLLGEWNSLPNVQTIGYISTHYGNKTIDTIQASVDQYAAWQKAEGWTPGVSYDIHIDGIFFDEISTNPAQLAHNTAITQYAKSKLSGTVVLNPGTTVQSGSESLFDVADAIMDIEMCYTRSPGRVDFDGTFACDPSKPWFQSFTPATLDQLGSNQTRLARSSILVHDFYDSWNPYQPAPLATLQADINAIVAKGAHSLYFSQWGYNSNFTGAEPASVTTVARLTAEVQGLA